MNGKKLKQTMGIILISIVLPSVTAIAAPANNTTKYDTTKYDTTTITSNPEVVAPNLIAAFTATQDPNKPLTVRFKDESIGKPVPYFWGGKQWTYFWGFGDKTTSKLKNPIHPFKEPGRYKVNLRIRNAEDQVSKAVMFINTR